MPCDAFFRDRCSLPRSSSRWHRDGAAGRPRLANREGHPPQPVGRRARSRRTKAHGRTTEVCVFCHTPHGATQADHGGTPLRAPLWNRQLCRRAQTYTVYDLVLARRGRRSPGQLGNDAPAGSSKLCLSCHDGTLAIGSVNVLNGGQRSASIQVDRHSARAARCRRAPGTDDRLHAGIIGTRPVATTIRSRSPTTAALATARRRAAQPVDSAQRWPHGSGSVIGLRAGVQLSAAAARADRRPCRPGTGPMRRRATTRITHDLHSEQGQPIKFLRLAALPGHRRRPTEAHSPAADIVCLVVPRQEPRAGHLGVFCPCVDRTVADETYNDGRVATCASSRPECPACEARGVSQLP